MSKTLVAAAVGVMLVANAWVVVSAWRNRAADPGGTLELTERELRLPPLIGESTAIELGLAWRTPANDHDWMHQPDWLTVAKLQELGFDCSVAPTSPHAADHYGALSPKVVFVVLEYEGEAWNRAPKREDYQTRLFEVDAGRDPVRLRQRYSDPRHYALTRAVVRPRLDRPGPKEGAPAPPPRLVGMIQEILPSQLFVPKPYNQLLQGLRRPAAEHEKSSDTPPRYAVTVSWGTDYLPWVREVRLLPQAAGGGTP